MSIPRSMYIALFIASNCKQHLFVSVNPLLSLKFLRQLVAIVLLFVSRIIDTF
ncbi:hypothetical protein BX666DRAFT_1942286 [Dichotomocladium elegans]|nr:hypothetical protein BX666DRAFT_1942286 [Dichotomocladium elegans]